MREERRGYLSRPQPSGLADVLDIVLDKGLVVDAYARVSVAGIELLTIDARIVVSSVDTYLRFAEATNRLDLWDKGGRDLTDMVLEGPGAAMENVASRVVEDKVNNVLNHVEDAVGESAKKVARGAKRKVAGAADKVAATVSDSSQEGETKSP